MISKKRLEELIEQGATIYGIDYGRCLMADMVEIKTKDIHYSASNDNFQYIYRENKDCYLYEFNEETLFETKEEAEWYREFGCIERTERLELPTWEKFDQSEKLIRFIGKFGQKCKLEGYFNLDLENLDLESGFIDVVENGTSKLLLSEYTKENYTLACRKAKELFLGEKE